MRCVHAAAFSPCGARLATLCSDDAHSLSLWDWRAGRLLWRRGTHTGAPPSVFGVAWSPHHPPRSVQNATWFSPHVARRRGWCGDQATPNTEGGAPV